VPVLLSNEQEYRLSENDVIAWLQSLPLDLRGRSSASTWSTSREAD
jgi:hypothetical protein